ncbi:hypothetical protein QWY86_18610 [Pedobacter aquatilis]|uniref:hypothetical protein n=1 Tax=Pedobacter aquatilis TaxID=351343 RepID=UPI0025B5F948|nr:hypothetical protein [Pedobacter aquatilis]MDN3588700.1 hypothetical protein [Pedobacter aquatilis]
MSSRGKKIFLALTIIVPMIIYCYIYYKPIIKNAPFRKNDFVSLDYKWGINDTLENEYNSADSSYRYLNSRDSVIVKKVGLKSDDILFIHSKANELGLWNFPDTIGVQSAKSKLVPRYDMFFKYKEKDKHVVIYGDFDGNPKLLDAAMQMRKIIEETINQAEKRSGK